MVGLAIQAQDTEMFFCDLNNGKLVLTADIDLNKGSNWIFKIL